MQRLFFPQLGTEERLLFRASLSFGFCVDLCVRLSLNTRSVNQWAGLNRAMQKQVLIFFCGGGAYSHYYIIEWNIPQVAFKLFSD